MSNFRATHDLQVTQIVMWVEDVNGCRKTKSVIADVLMNGTFVVTARMKGKIYPFSLQITKDDVVGFYVQVEHSRR